MNRQRQVERLLQRLSRDFCKASPRKAEQGEEMSEQTVEEELLAALKGLLVGYGYRDFVSEEERSKEPDVIAAKSAILRAEAELKARKVTG